MLMFRSYWWGHIHQTTKFIECVVAESTVSHDIGNTQVYVEWLHVLSLLLYNGGSIFTSCITTIGSNDSPDKTSNVIMKDILKLRTHIESVLPQTKVYLSCPVLRLDHVKAGLTLYQL